MLLYLSIVNQHNIFMKKLFFLILLVAVSASMAFGQTLKHSTTWVSSTADTVNNDTITYFNLGKFNSGGFILQVNHFKVSGFVKGYGYLESSSDGETTHLWKPVAGDTFTLANSNNIIQVSKTTLPNLNYRYVYKGIDSTQKSYLRAWVTPVR